MIFVGDDWAEAHHDVAIIDEQGHTLARRRLSEGLAGVAQLHALVAEHAAEPGEVVIGIETDRGLWVHTLAAAGYEVYAINPLAVARYREMEDDLFARFTDTTCVTEPDAVQAATDILRAHGYAEWTVRTEGFSDAAPCAGATPDPVNGMLTLSGTIRPELNQAVLHALDADSCGPANALVERVQDSVSAAGFSDWTVDIDHRLAAQWPCVAGFDAHPDAKDITLVGHASQG